MGTTAERAPQSGAEQVHADVAQRAQAQDWAETAAERFGQVNLVIDNAGVALTASVEWSGSTSSGSRASTSGTWPHGTKSFLPHLRRADLARGAHLVDVSSSFALFGMPMRGAYSATKAPPRTRRRPARS
ncbi:SDR family NAD(P)-dependent oxidoreductase, partial [Embleya sp. NPDC005575]|uniref:SDR family NAD(P)-dependent oxidoreductase n=1 Tax=Embleya sp. NPDC005575 TaxID=3156892 RepID=UPI0033B2C3D7